MYIIDTQASGIIFYRNVLSVLLNGPVLIVNWYVLQASHATDDDGTGFRHQKGDDSGIRVSSTLCMYLGKALTRSI